MNLTRLKLRRSLDEEQGYDELCCMILESIDHTKKMSPQTEELLTRLSYRADAALNASQLYREELENNSWVNKIFSVVRKYSTVGFFGIGLGILYGYTL